MTENERLKALRKQLGLTLAEMGEKIGITYQAVSLIEKGKSRLTERTVLAVCAAFPQVNANWLRTGEGDMFQEASDKDQIISMLGDLELPEITERFAVAYTSLSEQEQRVVNNYIRSVIADLVAKYHKEEAIHDEDAEPSFEERKRILIQELEDEEASGEKSSASIGGEGTMA